VNPYGGGFRTFIEPVSDELQQFPSACGEVAAKEGTTETERACFRRAGEFCAAIAVDHFARPLGQSNVQALGISGPMVMAIEPIVYIAPGVVENAAEKFCKRYALLIKLIAEAIAGYETGPGGREVVLL
jgi:hypothetical protein